jgi:IclR family transcriptional regulator, pca regulon regulatory protein
MPPARSKLLPTRENHATPPRPHAVLELNQAGTANGDPNFMTSFARGLAVIQAFSTGNDRMTISEISHKTGFSRAAVRRCLYTLVKLGFADTENDHYFCLRPRILSLGYSFISSMPLLFAAEPVLERLGHQGLETCWVGICMLQGYDAVCVAHANVTRVMSLDIRVGSRLPLLATAVGHVLLAYLPRHEQDSYIAQMSFARLTKHTISGPAQLRNALRTVRRNGYSIVDQSLEMGVWALAVPIHPPSGKVVATVGVAGLSHRLPVEKAVAHFLARLEDAARELSMLVT